MIPTQEMVPYPVFGDNATKVQPDDPKYAAGFDPGDVLPAEWLNWFLSRASGAVTKLNAGALSMEQEINKVLQEGGQTPDATLTNQLLAAINYIINQVRLDEQQKVPVGVPTIWMGPKPDWALDFGNGAATQYLWANYPKLNNDKFKYILNTLSGGGHMTAYDSTGFYVPDLRGLVPIAYGLNGIRTGEVTSGGTLAEYQGSRNKAHTHTINHTHSRGTMDITGSIFTMIYDSTFAQGAFYETNTTVNGKAPEAGLHVGTAVSNFQASRNWNGSTSDSSNGNSGQEGSVAKPPTIAFMWIVRFE